MKLVIFGTGAHARKVYHAANSGGHEVLGFADENPQATAPVAGVPVVDAAALAAGTVVFVAIGNAQVRRRLMQALEARGVALPAIVHARASVAPDAVLEAGAFVAAGAVVESQARVGRGAIVDIGALVDHDARVEDFTHLKPGQLAGAAA